MYDVLARSMAPLSLLLSKSQTTPELTEFKHIMATDWLMFQVN